MSVCLIKSNCYSLILLCSHLTNRHFHIFPGTFPFPFPKLPFPSLTRSYALHLPAHYDTSNTVATPLVLDYHGWSGTAHDQMVNMPWRDVADVDPQGFIYVTMEGRKKKLIKAEQNQLSNLLAFGS